MLEPLVDDRRRQRILSVTGRRIGNVTVLLDGLHDPHNLAAVLRSCEAFGLEMVHVLSRAERLLLSRRVACGTEAWVEVMEHRSADAARAWLEARGFELVAAHPQGELVPEELAQIPLLAIVLGNEHSGIHPELLAGCRHSVRVPMRGFVQSLNVSVCAAILVSAATRCRTGDLSSERQRELYARALWRTVPRAAEVLRARAAQSVPGFGALARRPGSEPVTRQPACTSVPLDPDER